MIHPQPLVLEERGVRLEPMTEDHHDALARAAALAINAKYGWAIPVP